MESPVDYDFYFVFLDYDNIYYYMSTYLFHINHNLQKEVVDAINYLLLIGNKVILKEGSISFPGNLYKFKVVKYFSKSKKFEIDTDGIYNKMWVKGQVINNGRTKGMDLKKIYIMINDKVEVAGKTFNLTLTIKMYNFSLPRHY